MFSSGIRMQAVYNGGGDGFRCIELFVDNIYIGSQLIQAVDGNRLHVCTFVSEMNIQRMDKKNQVNEKKKKWLSCCVVALASSTTSHYLFLNN